MYAQKPRVMEIQVRMDCKGCVQKIKKALSGINGTYDLQIDFSQQKIIVIGWADPEKVIKAINKTRRVATVCSPTEVANAPAPDGGAPPPDNANPPGEAPAPAAEPPPPPSEPPKDQPPQPPENPSPGAAASETKTPQPPQSSGPKDVGEVHVVYQPPPIYSYGYDYAHGYGPAYSYGYGIHHRNPGFTQEQPEPAYVIHSYNTYQPSPYITGYQYAQSPPRSTPYGRMNQYYEGDYDSGSSSNGNITSMFSDENPNACTIS
ncbi:hypothetical protein Dimus_028517 [Dionaea muscipula]